MDTSRLELAAQRYLEGVQALEAARIDLEAEAVAALREENAADHAVAEVTRITGWSPEDLARLTNRADEPAS